MIPIVAVVGASGAGKTTLLEAVVREFKRRGYRVGVAKHTHHPVDLDQPGKDSWRLAQAGSDAVVLGSARGLTLFDYGSGEVPLEQVASMLEGSVDLLLAEGYRDAPVPKIAVVREAVSRALPCAPQEILALVSDVALPLAVPQFSLDQGAEVAAFLLDHFRHPHLRRLAWVGAPQQPLGC
ncbi:MAG: molybdopterin-guanine dinucleotide biosynthesis protein B [Chloroflexi bacterium]|nr:molybdopterin-guanine dinucleotide biosynthesis protein B [Chloroflexota bacterium]